MSERIESQSHAADSIVSALDSGNRNAAAQLFQEYSQTLSTTQPSQAREMKRQLISSIDSQERDGVGDDIAVKYDGNGTPLHFSMLSAEVNAHAKSVASRLDSGNTPDAAEEFASVVNQLDNNRDQQLFILAIDAYEKDGQGRDVAVQYDQAGQPVSFEIDFSPRPLSP